MRRIVSVLVLCAAAATFAQQPAPAPSPLDALAFLEGNWAGKQNFNNPNGSAVAGEATDRIGPCIAGRYFCEQLSTTMPGRKPTDSRHFISYDKQAGTYTAWWFNDTGTRPTDFTGELSGNKLVLTSKPAGPGPVLRATYESPSKNTLTFLLEMQQGESWMKLFLTTYSKSDSQ